MRPFGAAGGACEGARMSSLYRDCARLFMVGFPGLHIDDEVFYVDRHYYVRQGDTWYRSRDHRGHWVVVEHRYVPVTLVKSPRGKYRRYRRHEHREVHVVREAPRHETRRVVYVEDDHHDHGKHEGHHGKKGHGGKKHKD